MSNPKDEKDEKSQMKSACHLYVILAREANSAVIFRRGPSKWVRLIAWDTKHDSFEPGQWFHGRIYHDRSDLSPDGSKLIYFARKMNGRTMKDKEYTYSWTAISKPPYFTALALWPKGDTYGGGGLFEQNNMVWINDSYNHDAPRVHPNHQPPASFRVMPYTSTDVPLRLKRLSYKGWLVIQEERRSKDGWPIFTQPLIICKDDPSGKYKLFMEYSGWNVKKSGGHEMLTFWLESKNGLELLVEADSWADWDQRGRLVYVRDGRLFAGAITPDAIEPTLLADFSDQQPEPMVAPDWAKVWGASAAKPVKPID